MCRRVHRSEINGEVAFRCEAHGEASQRSAATTSGKWKGSLASNSSNSAGAAYDYSNIWTQRRAAGICRTPDLSGVHNLARARRKLASARHKCSGTAANSKSEDCDGRVQARQGAPTSRAPNDMKRKEMCALVVAAASWSETFSIVVRFAHQERCRPSHSSWSPARSCA